MKQTEAYIKQLIESGVKFSDLTEDCPELYRILSTLIYEIDDTTFGLFACSLDREYLSDVIMADNFSRLMKNIRQNAWQHFSSKIKALFFKIKKRKEEITEAELIASNLSIEKLEEIIKMKKSILEFNKSWLNPICGLDKND
jgi:hypothetical protein